MSFGQAISSVFSKYATFSGRARRREYWFWVLFTIIVYAIAAAADSALGLRVVASTSNGVTSIGWITLALALLFALPTLAVTFRRLHDTGRSGWWWVLSLVCGIGAIILLVFCLSDSKPGANQYGPNPKNA